MFKKIMSVGLEDKKSFEIKSCTFDVAGGKLSDGKETVRLAVDMLIETKKGVRKHIYGVVIPPKGTSDGFHEALDSKDLDTALRNTRLLWQKAWEAMLADNFLFRRPERVCELVDDWGGWKEYGAQAALAVREMVFKVSAQFQGLTLEEAKHRAYKSVGGLNEMAFAIPQSVMLSAAKHGNGIKELDFPKDKPWLESISKEVKGLPWQEWMIQLTFVKNVDELLVAGETFHDTLYWLLREKGDDVKKLSKEGGMTVTKTKTPYEIIDLYKEAVRRLGQRLGRDLELGRDVHLAIDGATTECYFPEEYIYSADHQDELLRITQSAIAKSLDGKSVSLNREQHWRYTQQVKETKGKLFDFHTKGTYHTVFSEAEAKAFEGFVQNKIGDQKFLESLPKGLVTTEDVVFAKKEIADSELNEQGYKKYALSSFLQVMLAQHLIETKGNVFSSIEDIMAEDDWTGYLLAFSILDVPQLVGDDFWVTNPARMVRFYRMVFNYMQALTPAERKRICEKFCFVPLIKENQVADPWKAILMIALSEHVQYLLHKNEFEFVKKVVDQDLDIDSVHDIKKMIAELHKRAVKIGLPKKPVIAAVVSHRSKSFGNDVDLRLGLATGSTGKIGAISSGVPMLEWFDKIDPHDPQLLTRFLKYYYAWQAVNDPKNPTTFNPDSVPGQSGRKGKKAGR
jgi:hypothetical protein